MFVANNAIGRVAHLATLPAANDALLAVFLKDTVELESVLRDYNDLAALLTNNDEANFTNYTRQTLAGITITVSDSLDNVLVNANDLLYTLAGGGTDNTLAELLVCYDPDTTGGTDSSIEIVTGHPFVFTTTGADLPVAFHPDGFFRGA